MRGHEINHLRSHLLRGDGQVSFILTILVIHHHEHAAGARVFDGFLYGCKGHRRGNSNIALIVLPTPDHSITIAAAGPMFGNMLPAEFTWTPPPLTLTGV